MASPRPAFADSVLAAARVFVVPITVHSIHAHPEQASHMPACSALEGSEHVSVCVLGTQFQNLSREQKARSLRPK